MNAMENNELNQFVSEVAERKQVVGVPGEAGRQLSLKVTPGSMVRPVASLLARGVEYRSNRQISEEMIEKYLCTLITWRVHQVNGSLRISSRDIPVPNFFNPVLAYIGKYEDPLRYLEIELTVEESEDLLTLEQVRDLSWELKASGLKMSTGLPVMKALDSDNMFRVEQVSTDLRTAGSDPGDIILLIRSMINIEYARSTFGETRTRYISVDDTYVAWEAIAAGAIA